MAVWSRRFNGNLEAPPPPLWDAAPMEVKDDGSYNGVFTPLGKHAAVVIAVTHTGGDPGSDGVVTSPVTLVTLP